MGGKHPPEIEQILEDFDLSSNVGAFGEFAQYMFSAGLVFNIKFTGAELEQLKLHPRWSLFDEKIIHGISTSRARPELPARPQNVPASANTTIWSFVKYHTKKERNRPCHTFYLAPPAVPITPSMYTLDGLIKNLAIENPISCADDTPLPEKLIIICKSFNVVRVKDPHLISSKAPRFTGFVKGHLSDVREVVEIPNNICRFGLHACFGYRIIAASLESFREDLHSFLELCGTHDFHCPRQSPPSSPSGDTLPLHPLTPVPSSLESSHVITDDDYLEDDDAVNEYISSLLEVVCSLIHYLFPRLIAPVSGATHKAKAKANEAPPNVVSRQQPRSSPSPPCLLLPTPSSSANQGVTGSNTHLDSNMQCEKCQ